MAHKLLSSQLVTSLLVVFIVSAAFLTFYSVTHSDPLPKSSLFTLVNEERSKAGLPALIEDTRLDTSSNAKCMDEVQLDEFAHNLSDGSVPWDFIKQAGVTYTSAGENLSEGYSTNEKLLKAWLASPEHRANILDKRYTHVGYAACQSRTYKYLVVQHFAAEPR